MFSLVYSDSSTIWLETWRKLTFAISKIHINIQFVGIIAFQAVGTRTLYYIFKHITNISIVCLKEFSYFIDLMSALQSLSVSQSAFRVWCHVFFYLLSIPWHLFNIRWQAPYHCAAQFVPVDARQKALMYSAFSIVKKCWITIEIQRVEFPIDITKSIFSTGTSCHRWLILRNAMVVLHISVSILKFWIICAIVHRIDISQSSFAIKKTRISIWCQNEYLIRPWSSNFTRIHYMVQSICIASGYFWILFFSVPSKRRWKTKT